MCICFFVFVSQLSIFIVNYLATLLVSPDYLPRLDFSEGVPYSYRTAFVIPAMLMDKKGIDKLTSDLELHYLSNPDPYLYFALITDFKDADSEFRDEDEALLEYARSKVAALNENYCPTDRTLFYLFHRPRCWNPEEKKWMAMSAKEESDGV